MSSEWSGALTHIPIEDPTRLPPHMKAASQLLGQLHLFIGTSKRSARHGTAQDLGERNWLPATVTARSGLDAFLIARVPPHYVVLDADTPEAETQLAIAKHPTLTVKTPNGRHYWYRMPRFARVPPILGLLSDKPKFSVASDELPATERSVDVITTVPKNETGDRWNLLEGYAVLPPTRGYSFERIYPPALLPTHVLTTIYECLIALDNVEAVGRASWSEPFWA